MNENALLFGIIGAVLLFVAAIMIIIGLINLIVFAAIKSPKAKKTALYFLLRGGIVLLVGGSFCSIALLH